MGYFSNVSIDDPTPPNDEDCGWEEELAAFYAEWRAAHGYGRDRLPSIAEWVAWCQRAHPEPADGLAREVES